jgi:predicted thioesterase
VTRVARLPDGREDEPMKDTLAAGITNEVRYTVTADMSPPHLPRVVLSTPTMIGFVEGACLSAAQQHLDEGETTATVVS